MTQQYSFQTRFHGGLTFDRLYSSLQALQASYYMNWPENSCWQQWNMDWPEAPS